MNERTIRLEVARHGKRTFWRGVVTDALTTFGYFADDPDGSKGEAAVRLWAKGFVSNPHELQVWPWHPPREVQHPGITPPPPEGTHADEVALLIAHLERNPPVGLRVELGRLTGVAEIDTSTGQSTPLNFFHADARSQDRPDSSIILQATLTRGQAKRLLAAGARVIDPALAADLAVA